MLLIDDLIIMLNHQNKQQNEKLHIDLFLFIKETF